MRDTARTVAAAVALMAVCGAAHAINFDPTGQAGQYDVTKAAVRVRGMTGAYNAVRVWSPFILDEDDGVFNATVVETQPGTSLPFGATTTFFSGQSTTAVRTITAFGTTDAANGGRSNNVFISEGASGRSNSFGTMLPDGTLVWRANFNSAQPPQNNLETLPIAWPANTAAPFGSGSPVFDSSFGGINGTPGGTVQTGTPGAERRPAGAAAGAVGGDDDLLTGNTTFDGGTGACPVGTSVWQGLFNNPNTPIATWKQVDCPVPTVPEGESSADARQTQPVLKNVCIPCPTGDTTTTHIAFGVGFSGGTPLTGGSARVVYLIVDEVTPANFADGFAVIEADGDGDPSTVNPDLRFVDHQATGGGGEPFVGGLFDMNECGEVVVVREDQSAGFPRYQVLLYRPIRTDCGIVGYRAPIVIAASGADGIEAFVQNTFLDTVPNPDVPTIDTLVPFSGVSIDDDGNISFVAVTEQFTMDVDVSNPPDGTIDGPRLLNTTNTIFFWDRATRSLFSVLEGGQNGDVLPEIAGPDSLALGIFAVDVASDTFCRDSMSERGKTIATSFRSGGNEGAVDTDMDGFDDNGGVLRPGGAERAVRGVVSLSMGPISDAVICADVNFDSDVNFADVNIILGLFNQSGCCLDGDLNGDDVVNFADLNLAIGQFNTSCN